MKLTWHGHACFELESKEGNIVFDPYGPGRVPGLTLPKLTADLTISSHGHGDHFYPEGVALSGKKHSIGLQQFRAFHDGKGGSLRGANMVSIVTAEGLRLAHLGDLGEAPSEELLEALRGLTVLMIPVGGYYTIDAKQAKAIVDAVRPAITIPMHYKKGRAGLQAVAELESFTALFPAQEVRYLDEPTLHIDRERAPVVVFPWPGGRGLG